MKVNPTKILWADPTQYVDGSPFTQNDFQAYELGLSTDAAPAVTVQLTLPVAFGVGESPIPDAVRSVTGTVQYVYLRTLDKYGGVSDWSTPFPVRFTARPLAPNGLEAA